MKNSRIYFGNGRSRLRFNRNWNSVFDPMAEGVVIQDANIRALGHNTTTDDVFEIVRKVRQKQMFH